MGTVCIIEDDSSTMIAESLLVRKLRPDLQLEQFMCPRLALRHYESNPLPDIVFTDFHMCPMSGGAFMKKFKAKGFDGPAYFVTADYRGIPDEFIHLVELVIYKPLAVSDFAEETKLLELDGACQKS